MHEDLLYFWWRVHVLLLPFQDVKKVCSLHISKSEKWCVVCPAADEELFEDNPEEYIRRDIEGSGRRLNGIFLFFTACFTVIVFSADTISRNM